MSRGWVAWLRCLLGGILLVAGMADPAPAFPGLIAGKGQAKRIVHTTHLVLLVHDPITVVTVMVDYEGPVDDFALLLPVPRDVTADDLRTVKREFVSRLDELTAPRFHEFFEKDPCEPGSPEQQWEHHALPQSPAFLNADDPGSGNDVVSREIAIPVEPVFTDDSAGLRYELCPTSRLASWLKAANLVVSKKALAELTATEARQVLIARVDPNRVELVGNNRLQLAGIRYVTRSDLDTIPSRLGLRHSNGWQDLFIYVLHPSRRFETVSTETRFPPTNLRVTRDVRERTAELYNALHDRLRERYPLAFWCEHVWVTQECGQPCPNAPLTPRELLSLGGDVVESELVSAAERNPEPSPEPEEQRQAMVERWERLSASQRVRAERDHEQTRRELARRRAIVQRHRYIVTRLHHRYDAETLPHDVRLGPTPSGVEGGTGIPRGRDGAVATNHRRSGRQRFQVRYNLLQPHPRVRDCSRPERWRWGKRWPHLKRVWNKVRVGTDLPAKRRDALDLDRVVLTKLPSLDLPGVSPTPEAPSVPATTEPSRCTCSTAGAPGGNAWSALLTLLTAAFRRRRARRPPPRSARMTASSPVTNEP